MDGLDDFKDLQGNDVNQFIREYRDSMKNNYADNVAQIQQQKHNDYASIMSQANKAGMMYSNFPERSKMQYESSTYLPNLNSAYKTYQTGLDKLRSSALGTYNSIKETQDEINHLNSLHKDDGSSSKKKTYEWGQIVDKTGNGDYWFYNTNDKNKLTDDNAVRFSTWARHNNFDDSHEGYMNAITTWLPEATQKRISDIVKKTNMKLAYNANGYGNTYDDSVYDGYSDDERGLLSSLGLKLVH